MSAARLDRRHHLAVAHRSLHSAIVLAHTLASRSSRQFIASIAFPDPTHVGEVKAVVIEAMRMSVSDVPARFESLDDA